MAKTTNWYLLLKANMSEAIVMESQTRALNVCLAVWECEQLHRITPAQRREIIEMYDNWEKTWID